MSTPTVSTPTVSTPTATSTSGSMPLGVRHREGEDPDPDGVHRGVDHRRALVAPLGRVRCRVRFGHGRLPRSGAAKRAVADAGAEGAGVLERPVEEAGLLVQETRDHVEGHERREDGVVRRHAREEQEESRGPEVARVAGRAEHPVRHHLTVGTDGRPLRLGLGAPGSEPARKPRNRVNPANSRKPMTRTPENSTPREAAWPNRKSHERGGPARYSCRSGRRESHRAAHTSVNADWALKARRLQAVALARPGEPAGEALGPLKGERAADQSPQHARDNDAPRRGAPGGDVPRKGPCTHPFPRRTAA